MAERAGSAAGGARATRRPAPSTGAVAVDDLLLGVPALGAAAEALAAGTPAGRVHLARPGWTWLVAALARRTEASLLVVCPEDDEARDLAADLEALLGRAAVGLWPSRGVPLGGVGVSPHLVGLRARSMAMLGRPRRVVVAGVPALDERVAPPAARAEPLSVAVGAALATEELLDRLAALGYERTDQVEERGDVAVRGGLVDVYPATADMPVRLEFFGDEIEGVRAFSPFTQRTIRPLERVVVWPAREPDPGFLVDPLDDPATAAARVVRLAPAEFPAAVRAARERFEDEAQAGALCDPDALLGLLEARAALDLVPPGGNAEPVFDAVEARFATRGQSEAEAELNRLARNGSRVVVAFGRRGDMERAALRMERVAATVLDAGQAPAAGAVGFSPMGVRDGFLSRGLGLAVIPENAILRRRRPTAERGLVVGRRLASFMDLRVGDHVVHEDHGIGRLTGFETRTVANVTRDYLALAFSGGDRLYVPHDQLDKVTRYVGADGSEPTLSKLGGKAWERMKARARAAVREMAGELISLYEARQRVEGYAFPENEELMAELERGFPHRETPDQQRAIDAVYDDMERARPMDRLICGDVGFGKTEIAVRAAFKAAVAGKQVMVLAPTTILAQQHLATFRERYRDLPVTLDMVNRFRSPAEVRDVLARFREGRLDIVIGTHRLLSMDVQPKDLGLVIVDEEQRFGVAQKEALRQLRVRTDVLAMSATPIPRTLQISLSGLRDISVIETPPRGRRPIATHVGEFDEGLVAEALRREKERGGQSFWLHNRVETITQAAERVRALCPELRVQVAHGQMAEHQLEDVMLSFIRGDGDVLVATSIIESGLDIPQANTLVVERADALGLSQLYQIRGRVGRSSVTAHAYLLYPDEGALTREAAARLRALADYTELGSGLRIAMRDLEIRGAGNLLGDEQSGHVAAVGFELYIEMLQEAVALGQGQIVPEREVRVDIPASAFIPADYVAFEAAKIELHRRISLASDVEAVRSLEGEIADRFGPLPPPVAALLTVQSIRVRLRRLGAGSVAVRGGRIVVAPVSLTTETLRGLREAVPRAQYQAREQSVSAPAPTAPGERLEAADALLTALAGAGDALAAA
ncbi:MAG TPA: transcription-repair coupling factor [Miltoncostaeaceae bacterium]|nr:transcription-repair coupling factor [Miltoncostaeaceae bacterium]